LLSFSFSLGRFGRFELAFHAVRLGNTNTSTSSNAEQNDNQSISTGVLTPTQSGTNLTPTTAVTKTLRTMLLIPSLRIWICRRKLAKCSLSVSRHERICWPHHACTGLPRRWRYSFSETYRTTNNFSRYWTV